MYAVIFEVEIEPEQQADYLRLASALAEQLQQIDGFISIERFQSLKQAGKLLSLSFWRDQEAIQQWRNLAEHRQAQQLGRQAIFRDYRLRVVEVMRDYGMFERHQAPVDSLQIHTQKTPS